MPKLILIFNSNIKHIKIYTIFINHRERYDETKEYFIFNLCIKGAQKFTISTKSQRTAELKIPNTALNYSINSYKACFMHI